MPECNICGSTSFATAPNNRLSRKKQAPLCTSCGSLERQRIGRELTSAVRIREKFKTYTLLDIGKDSTVAKGWFASSSVMEPSDAMIDRLGNREKFDFIVCSHVIQNLRDPRRAISRLVSSLSDDGILFLNYPSPVTRRETEQLNTGYRSTGPRYIFGRDFEQTYHTVVPEAYVVAAEGTDPVTQDTDIVYFATKSPFWTTQLVKNMNARLVH